MDKLFQMDSPLMNFLSKVASLVALNLLWLLCCIPVVTIGASTTAMYCVTRDMAKGDWPSVVPDFIRAFAGNFKQSVLIFFILLIPVCLAISYLLLTITTALGAIWWFKALCYIAIAIVCVVCSYVYPLLANFDNSIRGTLKNAMLLPLANPLLAAVVTALNLLPILLLMINTEIFSPFSYFWVTIGSALTAFVNTKMLLGLFRHFVPKKEQRSTLQKPGEEGKSV